MSFSVGEVAFFHNLEQDIEGFGVGLSTHKDAGALFIVDEASMIGRSGSEGAFGARDLLTDLFEHVFSAADCKLLLIGDPHCQVTHETFKQRVPAEAREKLRARYAL